MSQTEQTKTVEVQTPGLRNFLKEACAIAICAIVGLVPFASGLVVWLDPLRRKAGGGEFVPVASLNALP